MSEIRIQDDLFEFVNGEWLKTAVIPDDRPTAGGFAELDKGVEKLMMEDFSLLAKGEKSTDVESMDDAVRLYKKVLNTEARNRLGIAPALPLLHRIQALKNTDELNAQLLELSLDGVPLPVEYGVTTDMQDTNTNCFVVSGPGIILPDTTYYGTPEGDGLIEIFSGMAREILSFTDLDESDRELFLKDTLEFDKLIAAKVKSQVEWADYVKCYNPTKADEVFEYLKPLDFEALLKKIYDGRLPETIIVYDPKAIKEMSSYFNEENFELYVHWAYVNTLLGDCKYLSEELYTLSNKYRRALTGIVSDPDIEKRAYRAASGMYSEPCGIYYGRNYFGEEAKKDITALVYRVIDGYKKRLAENAFLEASTKEKAILKLSAIKVKMGYPDNADEFYSTLKISEDESYYECVSRLGRLHSMHELHELYKKVDRSKWVMAGHVVNACYDPGKNDITFPAAILQEPFYSIRQSASKNLGGIGAVIAHEISHAFDNNGSHFDENGNLANWWTEKDFANFEAVTKKMTEQWDGLEFAGGKVNGELVVSENIADNGGMAVTLQIMHELEKPDFAEYFMNWARVWCQKAKPEYQALLLSTDVHSPAKLRANIQVRNFEEWYETFGVSADDEMYIAPEKRITVW